MNIGLIIYSHTGNTRSFAGMLQEKITTAGHAVSIEEITITGHAPAQPGKFELDHVPDPAGYDAVILGAPVQAFTLNPVMKAYLEKLPSLSGKKTALFVTKRLPMLWIGGTGAIRIMKTACEEKGANVVGTEIVVWSEKKREQSIEQGAKNLTALF